MLISIMRVIAFVFCALHETSQTRLDIGLHKAYYLTVITTTGDTFVYH